MFKQRLLELTNGNDSITAGLGLGLALVAVTVVFVLITPALWVVTQVVKS